MLICVCLGLVDHGKSYFTKLMAARNRYMNIAQYIIDPEREYTKLCDELRRKYYKF